MSIIKRKTSLRLIRQGKASSAGLMYDGKDTYRVINRHDLSRTDHYLSLAGCDMRDKPGMCF